MLGFNLNKYENFTRFKLWAAVAEHNFIWHILNKKNFDRKCQYSLNSLCLEIDFILG